MKFIVVLLQFTLSILEILMLQNKTLVSKRQNSHTITIYYVRTQVQNDHNEQLYNCKLAEAGQEFNIKITNFLYV